MRKIVLLTGVFLLAGSLTSAGNLKIASLDLGQTTAKHITVTGGQAPDDKGIDLKKDAATLPFQNGDEEIAKQGCCSHHGGVCGCSNGRVICCDGTKSPSCTCSN